MVLHTTLLLLIAVASFSARMASANWGSHGSSSSQYIHSNDTFTLQLSATQPNILHGPPDSYIDLNFILHNKGYGRNYFALSQSSEDGFTGTLSTRSAFLDGNQQTTIRVSRLRVPHRKNGEVVLFTLTARKQQARRKRREEAPGGRRPGGSNTNPGNYNPGGGNNYNPGGGSNYNPGGGNNYNPGGSNYNPGGGNNYNPGGSNYKPGGGSNYNPGGGSNYKPGGGSNYKPGGGSNYKPGGGNNYKPGGGNNYKPGGGSNYRPGGGSNYKPGGSSYQPEYNYDNHPNWNPNFYDPDDRDEVQITIEYVITTEPMRDHTKPWTDVEYHDSDEGCRYGPDDRERCQNEWWRAKFRVQDEDTGLHLITVTNTGKQNYQNNVYYWYENFKIGTKNEHHVYAFSLCCKEGMHLRVTDVAGNVADQYAAWNGVAQIGSTTFTIIWIVLIAMTLH